MVFLIEIEDGKKNRFGAEDEFDFRFCAFEGLVVLLGKKEM